MGNEIKVLGVADPCKNCGKRVYAVRVNANDLAYVHDDGSLRDDGVAS
jgi:hypothetical protein